MAKQKQKLGGEPLRKGLVKVKGMSFLSKGTFGATKKKEVFKIKESDAKAILAEDNETNYPANEGW